MRPAARNSPTNRTNRAQADSVTLIVCTYPPGNGWGCCVILGAIDEFQRELIIEGTREGVEAARARGRR